MTTQVTPSKKVQCLVASRSRRLYPMLYEANPYPQAASSIENLKMDASPAKKINFTPTGKENVANDVAPRETYDDLKKPPVNTIKIEEKAAVAPGIKPEESDEPLLQENPHRFVLFPIKYHEVRLTPLVIMHLSHPVHRSGKCTRRPRHPSGRPRRSTCPRISMTGMRD